MSIRTMNLIVYAALAVLSILVIRAVSDIPVTMPGDVGSGFLPGFLAWLILGFSGLGAVRAILAGDGGRFGAEYLGRVLITIGVIAGFLLSWQYLGFFFLQCFLFLFGLFTYYRWPRGPSVRLLVTNAGVAAGITLLCYVTFTYFVFVDL
ncbi:tripartite tricarboxylate transporter TctB family protein [Oceanibium sediminis]|uniref:tripartite tricarboxylate transporter TctB family protein n=1 Tax=Oceanibium sediminis TaxID=2026339 RepID=UPI000DD30B8C|nr:tripartite tricarboxylate transporter TctB family protein [Oceanibium sediminis]